MPELQIECTSTHRFSPRKASRERLTLLCRKDTFISTFGEGQGRLGQLRKCSYRELKQMIEDRLSKTEEVIGQSGNKYQIEIQAFWDDQPGGHIRVRASIDDGGWRVVLPLTSDFIMAADGSFVGE